MMQDRMTAAEYRKQFVDPALQEEDDDQEFLKRLRGENVDKGSQRSIPRTTKNKDISSELVVKKPRNDEEDQITMQVADYCELLKAQGKVTAFSHIPNSTFTKSWSVKNRNTSMGVRAGVPDMLIVFPDKVLFLELKRLKGGKVSEAQKAWVEALTCVSGNVYAAIAAGFDEAKREIDDLLE